ncbi:MAG: acetyl-CoA carboxylase biotin carboxylase subunit [Chloroflexota bacterium]|nr:acetyl-CoA carboxylase biotin carboxylase subunit [Chloroflexota bacterium]
MFSKILIANRGEIAVRIIQTCHEMGIKAVAVYSDADADALHVRRADEAYCIGPAPATQSYLDIDHILTAARESGSQAIHPGYGFLAENPAFARAVVEAGLTWIGPSGEVIALLGDKVAAKELAHQAGVPIIPGYYGREQSIRQMTAAADEIGYPIMLKAAAGGGGKGMRIVNDPAEMAPALEAARREAQSAFGDDRIFLERLVVKPRHIEIQILLDACGNGVYLGERECSLQRRHQKVVEESPSPVMTRELRTAMGEDALRVARASGYTNAGTVEFLFGGDSYYFLEVNTRIQVEHPVTEMVTGLDLVRRQIEIASGRTLELSQLDVELKGHAIEVRLYAEDPATGFLPTTGTVDVFDPPLGAGIRNDVGIAAGGVISPYYDPLLAKLIVHAASRAEAALRLDDALSRYAVLGVVTNLSFLHWIAQQAWFREGRIHTGTLAETWSAERALGVPAMVVAAAAFFEMLSSDYAPAAGTQSPWRRTSGWRQGRTARTFRYQSAGSEHAAILTLSGDSWRVTIDGTTHQLGIRRAGNHELILQEGPEVWSMSVAAIPPGIAVEFDGVVYRLTRPVGDSTASVGARSGRDTLVSPMPGTVVKVAVEEGQRVLAHEPLVILEAMKMEHVIEAPHDGVVGQILFHVGDLVPANEPVVRLEAE